MKNRSQISVHTHTHTQRHKQTITHTYSVTERQKGINRVSERKQEGKTAYIIKNILGQVFHTLSVN